MPRLSRSFAGPAAAAALIAVAALRGADPAPAAPAEPAAPAAEKPAPEIENSVVKVFATMRYPNLAQPWNKLPPQEVSGSGVVIDGKRILTNAHVVLYASQLQVQPNQAGDKLNASVEAIAPGIDLAVLKLDDETFFATHAAVPRAATMPNVKDSVMVYGYPTGGTTLSITKGIVSRIEFTPYNYPVSGLRIQIDAAINPGNSGGPAIVGDKMVGLAFSRLGGGAENIGYIIPSEEIDLFLQDIADGHYDGKPGIYDDFQTLENPALRAYLKLPAGAHGIVVHAPYRDDPAYPLKQWDVITKIGGTPIDDQGMVRPGGNVPLAFSYLVQKVVRGGKVPLTLVRAGKELAVELPVSVDRPRLLPYLYLTGQYPSYFIYGPLAFTGATDDFVNALTSAPQGRGAAIEGRLSELGNPLVTRRGARPAFAGEQLVVIPAPFFPHRLSQGYESPFSCVVKAVNGVKIRNLRHLVEVLRDCKDPFITIEFSGEATEALVLPRQETAAVTEDILNDNGIRSQGSPDMMEVWNAKMAK